MSITKTDFDYISNLAKDASAIVIGANKGYLIETRLDPLARKHGFESLEELIEELRGKSEFTELHAQAIDALTTNETYFFRDFHPFESLKNEVFPELLAKRSQEKSLRIWSAACSTGQEPYSIAILIRDNFPELCDWNVSILATDLSERVLEKAKLGRYNQLEINRGLPAHYLAKYFVEDNEDWRISSNIREMVEFRPMNLSEPWPFFQPFDLILIRNVLIYFDIETKLSILRKLKGCLLSHGHLILGSSETTINLDPSWNPIKNGKGVTYQAIRQENNFSTNFGGSN